MTVAGWRALMCCVFVGQFAAPWSNYPTGTEATSVPPTTVRRLRWEACGSANVVLVAQNTQSHILALGGVVRRKEPICAALTQRPCAPQYARAEHSGLLCCHLAVHCLAERDHPLTANTHLGPPLACWRLYSLARQADTWRTRTSGRCGSARLPLLRQLKRTQVAVAWHF